MYSLKIAVVGVGLGGKTHIKCLNNSTFGHLDSIIAPDTTINNAIAKQENVPIFHSIDECLRHRVVDGIIIASPNQDHAKQAALCINSGIPVLIEKPIASSVNDALELVSLVNKKNAKVLVGHHRAHSPIMKASCDLISQGRLGKIVSLMGSAQFYKPDHYFDDGPWRKEYGGGPILINLIHEIHNLRMLLGEISQVQAITSNNVRRFIVEDTVVINLVFESGVLGTFILSDTASTSRSWEQTTEENQSYPSYPNEDCYLISGTKGSLGIPTMRLQYYAEGTIPSWWSPFTEETLDVLKQDPLNIQLINFFDVINGKSPPLVTAYDGYRNLIITAAIKESAIKKSIIDIQR